MTVSFSRAERRWFDKLGAAVDKVTAADARFFERFPARTYRVRLASSVEIAQNAMLAGWFAPGARWIVLVKQLDDGVRLRAFATAIGWDDFDLSEAEARELWDEKVRPGSDIYRIEAQMRAALVGWKARQ